MTRARPFLLGLAASLLLGAAAAAQEPPDTVVVEPAPLDTLPVPDTLEVDSLAADSLPPREIPRLRIAPPGGWATETWTFGRDDLMGLRDLTLLELLEEVPGVVPLRGGDYGAPEAATAIGLGPGRVRVFFDGFEALPLDGSVADLALVGLGGIEEVIVERGPGELRIHLESFRAREPRPFSLIEAGTGDTDTNFFRGTFVHPDALGGILGFALDRVDTKGPFRRERGHRSGGWLSWGRALGERFHVRAEARRYSRDVRIDDFPVGVERTDWTVRGRGLFLDGRLTAELFSGASALESRDDEPIVPLDLDRRQHGLRALWASGPVWGAGTLRLLGGPEMPARSVELEGGGALAGLGGAHARGSLEAWPERDVSALALRAWSVPAWGFSAFGSYATGTAGAAVYPPYEPLPADAAGPEPAEPAEPLPGYPPPGHRFTERTTLRLGAGFEWRRLLLQGAWIRVDADSLPPLGLVLDRAGPTVPGGVFQAIEGSLRVSLPVEGFTLNGSFQAWDGEARYLPKRMYQAAIDFHDVFLETRNLEVWGAVGVKGRDPMLVPPFEAPEEGAEAALARVPFYQSWYLDVQVRVLPVHVFIRWENFVLRQNLQDFPGRVLPVTRAIYGVKWILWN